MKRLFTFGCSFTEYGWPSWADLLSVSYDHYENWGLRGVGNRAIAERVSECHVKNKFTKDDTVIIQWSSHLRHDWFNLHKFPEGRSPGWKTAGSIFSPMNSMVFSKEWVEIFFHEYAYTMHTLNNIKLVQELLKNSKCTWYMTGIGDVRNLGSDIRLGKQYGESITGYSPSESFTILERYPEFEPYVVDLWDNNPNNWLEPLHTFSHRYPEYNWEFLDENGTPWPESHLSVTQYGLWVKEILRERLPISQEDLLKIDKIVKIIEDMKVESNHLVLDFAKKMYVQKFETFTLIEKEKIKGYPI